MKFETLLNNRFTLLLASMLALITVIPFLSGKQTLIVPCILVALMVGIFRTLQLSRLLMIACVALGIVAGTLDFIIIFAQSYGDISGATYTSLTIWAVGCYCVFLGISIFGLLLGVLDKTTVTGDMISGSLSVYLLIGLFFALLYRGLFVMRSVEFSAGIGAGEFHLFLYFSFTTLTTLGYGDIAPAGSIARSFTTLETIIGPVFLTVLVSRLVGHYVVTTSREE